LNEDIIEIKGAKLNNLKSVDVKIPHNKIVVVTGVSGSGKSSLIFDTLYAEGQRRYVESLSSYARQFLSRMKKPEVDYINGLSPAIAIEQKVNTRNPRSTVSTSTEIYDYLKLLFARVGRTFSPVSGNEVKRESVKDVLAKVATFNKGVHIYLLVQLSKEDQSENGLNVLLQKGFVRLMLDEKIEKIENVDPSSLKKVKNVYLVLDRLVHDPGNEDEDTRLADSIESGFWEGKGRLCVMVKDGDKKSIFEYSNLFELDGISFELPTESLLSFNNPHGACTNCGGFGEVLGIDEKLVIPDRGLSLYEGAVFPWRSESMQKWKHNFINNASNIDFPIHKPYYEYTQKQKDLLWNGNDVLKGIKDFFAMVEEKSYKIQYRVLLSRYRGKTKCMECNGARIRKDANYIKLVHQGESNGIEKYTSISDVLLMSVDDALNYFNQLELTEQDYQVAERILKEINNRLKYLSDVGLGYLTLVRRSNTLSGGESQRINLATSLGSNLVGATYILDEPSIGLHPRDTGRLLKVLKKLKESGNTVIVVEHEEEIMKAADELIDIGPLAGTHGGELVYQGDFGDFVESGNGLTSEYLRGDKSIDNLSNGFIPAAFIEVNGARENNLKNIDVKVPLEAMTVVTGVSGSGKSSLVHNVIYPGIAKELEQYGVSKVGEFDSVTFNKSSIGQVEMVNQDPIGKSSRSNPVTYSKAYDHIRELFAGLAESKVKLFEPKHYSFNVEGGRCEMCKGEGVTTIEMQFMADIELTCESCDGHRFKEEVLDVKFKGKNISDVLNLTVEEALEFFEDNAAIINKLKPLDDVGLGYVKLGQSSNTLSGGEAQRVKLASFLAKSNSRNYVPSLFIFDEPTTGLHFHDINKLVKSLKALVSKGNTVLIVEHNTEVIKCSDWIIDLGPEAGMAGGSLVYQGETKGILEVDESHTAKFLKDKF
jgi:excinuclease ABC subunit A